MTHVGYPYPHWALLTIDSNAFLENKLAGSSDSAVSVFIIDPYLLNVPPHITYHAHLWQVGFFHQTVRTRAGTQELDSSKQDPI